MCSRPFNFVWCSIASPGFLILAIIGLFSIAPVCDAARGGGFASRPAASVSRVAAAPSPAPSPLQSQASVLSSFRALRNDVRNDFRGHHRGNQNSDLVESGSPYGYYGYDPADALQYAPNGYELPGADQTPDNSAVGGGAVAAGDVDAANGQRRDELYREQDRLQAHLEASPGWANVNADINTSRAAIAASRQRAEESFANSPQFQVAQAQKTAAEDLLATLRSADHPDEARIWSVARQKLQASQTITCLEQQTLAADRNYAEASSKLQFAAIARAGMLESVHARMQDSASR